MSLDWINGVRDDLLSQRVDPTMDAMSRHVFFRGYRLNQPLIIQLPKWPWPARDWSLDNLTDKIGADTMVQIQRDRSLDPNYEFNAPAHRDHVTFQQFCDLMTFGQENDVYMTAQNAGANAQALAPLWGDVGPLPSCLTQEPERGFLWLGKNTTTPLHHDLTNNLMCQMVGIKKLRLFSPEQRDHLDPWIGVHSHLGWVDDQTINERGLRVRDVTLWPGDALFLPIGWWHCVKSYDVSCTIVYTNFVWRNYWGEIR